jgi:hypothetical protein
MNNIMKIVIIIILAITIIYLLNKTNKEYFDFETDCKDCKKKSYHQCLNCKNCGSCSDQFGNLTCVPGTELGPTNDEDKKSCYRWFYGNIYPQYYKEYYDDKLLSIPNDARFYPFSKTVDDEKNTEYYEKGDLNNFYSNFNTTLKPEFYNRR